MSQPDLGALLARAREMQERLAETQRDLARRTVEGSAGGGMVVAVASGELRLTELRIEPQILADGDRAMLLDLVVAAANAALTAAQQMVQEEMQRAAGGDLALFGAGGGPPGDSGGGGA